MPAPDVLDNCGEPATCEFLDPGCYDVPQKACAFVSLFAAIMSLPLSREVVTELPTLPPPRSMRDGLSEKLQSKPNVIQPI